MAHGGTTFGFGTGADRPFKPDTSSYDYDAPISEAGWPTEKFWKTRELFARYLNPGETIPEPPAKNPVITIRVGVSPRSIAPLFDNLPAPRDDDAAAHLREPTTRPTAASSTARCSPRARRRCSRPTRSTTSATSSSTASASAFMDRRSRRFRVDVPERTAEATLDILVEAMGRVNFGVEVHDRKGLHAPGATRRRRAHAAGRSSTSRSTTPCSTA